MTVMERLARSVVVPVVVLEKAEDAVPTAKALLAGGVDTMEITFRTACAPEAIRAVAENCPEVLVGAGTVINLEQCKLAVSMGANEEDAKDVFGIEAEATDIYGGSLNHQGYKSVAKQLADKFGFEMVAITLRESHSAFDNGWSAMLYNVAKDEYCFSKKYDLHIIDRVGGGDSFGGGLIYSLLSGKDTQAAVEFAVAASALKHSVEGDYNMVTVSEVEKLAGGDGSGRIQR